MKYTNNRLPPAPRMRRVRGLSPTGRTSTALEHVQGITKAERGFDPSKRGSWKGSSRDLVVNAGSRIKAKAQPGYAYKLADVGDFTSWKDSVDDDWETVMLVDSKARQLKPVGFRHIDGARCTVFETGDKTGYYAQMSNMSRNAAAGDYVPEHLRAIDFRYNDPPEENGESIRYGSFDMGEQSHGREVMTSARAGGAPALTPGQDQWYEVEYATGSDYSGGSVTKANNTELKKLLEEAHPEGESPAVWAEAHGGHGTYALLVVWEKLDESIQETLNALEDYPAISDESVSEVEREREEEAWSNWAQSDFEKHFLKSLNAQIQADDPEYEVDDWPDDIESFTLFHMAMEQTNTNWTHEEGDNVYVDLKRLVDGKGGAIDIVLYDARPKWISAEDNTYLDELDEALGLKAD